MSIQAKFDKAVAIVQGLPKDGPVKPTQDDQLYVRSFHLILSSLPSLLSDFMSSSKDTDTVSLLIPDIPLVQLLFTSPLMPYSSHYNTMPRFRSCDPFAITLITVTRKYSSMPATNKVRQSGVHSIY